MANVITLILGGGQGSRLYPLTKVRSKPAVPIAGKHRLIDIPLSNCINSGLNKIYVLTQFNSESLHWHIRNSFVFDHFNRGFVEILAAQQTATNMGWYQGTADAVRQNLHTFNLPDVDYVLILSGDQLYSADFGEMIETHVMAQADVTIAGLPVLASQTEGLGVMKLDKKGKVTGFLEKPKSEAELKPVRMSPKWIGEYGNIDAGERDCLANMGIYLFNKDVLVEALTKTECEDFGKEVFPEMVQTHHVQMHLFDGYWEDIGTIRAFYEANLALAQSGAAFNLYDDDRKKIFTRPRFLPPSRVDGATIKSSIISDGCIIGEGAVIENSIIGLRSHVGKGVVIKDSILMGNDYYRIPQADGKGEQIRIGDGSKIIGAIVDKNCQMGENVVIENTANIENQEENAFFQVVDGVIVIPKNRTIPADFKSDDLWKKV